MINSFGFITSKGGRYINPNAISVIEPSGSDVNIKLITGENVKIEQARAVNVANAVQKAAGTGEIIDIKA